MPPEPARVIHRAGSNDESSQLEKHYEPARVHFNAPYSSVGAMEHSRGEAVGVIYPHLFRILALFIEAVRIDHGQSVRCRAVRLYPINDRRP